MQALEEIIDADVPPEICDEFLSNQIKALSILYVADKTNNYERVDYANILLMDFYRLLDEPGDWLRKTNHGSIMLGMRTLILFEDMPNLLYPETVAKLREGKEPDGTINPEESLKSYFDETCWDPDRHIGIHQWPTAWEGAWEYTENHRLQMTANALLMCQIFENESYNPSDGKPKATWIKPDYSLGFGIDSWVGWGYHAGGAYVASKGNSLREAGLAILPFGMDDNNHFNLKYSEICPMHSEDTPRKPGTIVRLKGENIPDWAYSIVPKDASGKIIKMELSSDYLIWEMSDKDQHPSFDDFKKDIVNNELTIDSISIIYISCRGDKLTLDRNTSSKHLINDHIVDKNNFRFVIQNPWGEWKQNQKEAFFKSVILRTMVDFGFQYSFLL
jgi:hypothetical protein